MSKNAGKPVTLGITRTSPLDVGFVSRNASTFLFSKTLWQGALPSRIFAKALLKSYVSPETRPTTGGRFRVHRSLHLSRHSF